MSPKEKSKTAPQPRPRDREATRRRLIRAVGTLLAREGFRAIGVNSVAREAAVDKVLIYRYFGGLPQLIRAFGREGDFWPEPEEIMGAAADEFMALAPAERFVVLARGYTRAVRRRPLTLEIMAWEMVERNELTAELEAVREEAMEQLIAAISPAPGAGRRSEAEAVPDIEAVSAIMGAAVNYLAVRSRHITVFSGLDRLDRPEGWERLEAAMAGIIRRLFSHRN